MEFLGFKVIEDVNLVQDGDPIEVKRTWHERLFTRPWHPFKTHQTIIPKVPFPGAIRLNKTTVIMHPAVIAQLRQIKK